MIVSDVKPCLTDKSLLVSRNTAPSDLSFSAPADIIVKRIDTNSKKTQAQPEWDLCWPSAQIPQVVCASLPATASCEHGLVSVSSTFPVLTESEVYHLFAGVYLTTMHTAGPLRGKQTCAYRGVSL